jgi:N-ethylmaleimide reductase
MSSKLLGTYTLGTVQLQNRVVMSPMTRCRADTNHTPTDIMATYYGQRASAGLIITEGTSPSPNGLGYARIPGLFAKAHVDAWRKVTEAVHAKGGRVFVQLMHTGRVSHPLNMPAESRVLSASALSQSGTMWTDQQGMQPYPAPAAMTEGDIEHAIQEYAESAALAIEAEFYGVELHGANGYLIDQFLNTVSNQRTDKWGGSSESRARFAIEVAKAVVTRIGSGRVGIRVSPFGVFNDMKPDAEMESLYEHLARELSRAGLVYIHVVDHSSMGAPAVPASAKERIRGAFRGAYILSGGYDRARAEADLAAGRGNLVAFGRLFIANPDLVARLQHGAELAQPDASTFYTPGEEGYTDYAAAMVAV